jgi:hypothetical protein
MPRIYALCLLAILALPGNAFAKALTYSDKDALKTLQYKASAAVRNTGNTWKTISNNVKSGIDFEQEKCTDNLYHQITTTAADLSSLETLVSLAIKMEADEDEKEVNQAVVFAATALIEQIQSWKEWADKISTYCSTSAPVNIKASQLKSFYESAVPVISGIKERAGRNVPEN